MTVTTCACGWRIEMLHKHLAELRKEIPVIEQSAHPMRSAMLQGQRSRIAALEGHLAEPTDEYRYDDWRQDETVLDYNSPPQSRGYSFPRRQSRSTLEGLTPTLFSVE